MSRRGILDTTRDILKLLKDKNERSVKSISYDLKIKWETALKSLEFLEEIGLVKERKGKVTFKAERLFSLK